MKNIFWIFILGLMVSCATEEADQAICADQLVCQDPTCLFTIDNASGQTMFLSCYARWGIFAPTALSDGSDTWLIVKAWDVSFEQADLDITFCGYVSENTVPLQFPDPSITSIYEIELAEIELK